MSFVEDVVEGGSQLVAKNMQVDIQRYVMLVTEEGHLLARAVH